jgi:hypothetical protein
VKAPTKKRKAPTKSSSVSPNLLTLFPEYRKKRYRSRNAEQLHNYLDELREAYLHRGLVLYLGSGVTRSIGLPSWPELIRILTVNMMTRKVSSAISALKGLSEEQQFQTFSSIRKDIEQEPDYEKPILMMARAIKDTFGEDLPDTLARILYRRLRVAGRFKVVGGRAVRIPPRDKLPRLPISPLLDEIVAIARSERQIEGVQAIVNYNFDDLLDEKLRDQKVRCVTVRSGKDRVAQGSLPCYHVHGVLPLKCYLSEKKFSKQGVTGNFVFSEDEYHAEYSDPYKWSNMTQMSLMGRYVGLFVGLSMEDPNIRRLIDVTHRQYPDIPHYAIVARKKSLAKSGDSKPNVLRNLFEEVETTSFQKIGVRVLWADSFEDVPKLIRQIYSPTE